MTADSSSRKIAMFKNGHLRLLMSLIGFQRVGEQDDPEGSWLIPSSLSADQLLQALDLIKKSEFSPPVFDDGQEAGDFIRRKSAGIVAKRKAVFDDDDDNTAEDDEEELLFPAGGPTAMKKSDALKALKQRRSRKRRDDSGDEDSGPSDEVLKARAEAKRLKELEKNRKIKSDLFVHESDDDDDEERDAAFFAQEEKLRERSKIDIMKELLGVGKEKKKGPAMKSRKRQSSAISGGSDESEHDEDVVMTGTRKREIIALLDDSDDGTPDPSERSASARDDGLADSDDGPTDTPISSPHARPSQWKKRKVAPPGSAATTNTAIKSTSIVQDDEDEDEDVAPMARPIRQRVRSGFIVNSSDEE